MPRAAFITAIYGGYEKTAKPHAAQDVPGGWTVDWICFSDGDVTGDGWQVDTTPYHETNPSPLDDGHKHNSLKRNRHTFNIAKYYKQQFHRIPRLADYDLVVWIDGTVEITNPDTVSKLLSIPDQALCATWIHEHHATMQDEMKASNFERYTAPAWFGQLQPVQDVPGQVAQYKTWGFPVETGTPIFCTCFVAWFMMRDREAIREFLNSWYDQTLRFTTQDQIGFPYVLWSTTLPLYPLPDGKGFAGLAHRETNVYKKHTHHL